MTIILRERERERFKPKSSTPLALCGPLVASQSYKKRGRGNMVSKMHNGIVLVKGGPTCRKTGPVTDNWISGHVQPKEDWHQ